MVIAMVLKIPVVSALVSENSRGFAVICRGLQAKVASGTGA